MPSHPESILLQFHSSIVASVGKHGPGHGRIRPLGLREYLLQMTLSGSARWLVAGRPFVAGAGDLTLLRPGEPQSVHTHGRSWRVISIFFQPRPHWLPWLDWPVAHGGLMHLHVEGNVRRQVERSLTRAASRNWRGPEPRDEFALAALEEALLWTRAINPRAAGAPADVRIQRVERFVETQLARDIGVGDLAQAAGVSRTHLFNLFRKTLRQTPSAYIEKRRLEHARQLLQFTDLPIARIASMVGYSDPFYFTNRFRRSVGVSPRAFRQASKTS